MIDFNYLLEEFGLDTETILCMRHNPEKNLTRSFTWLAAGNPSVIEAYQSVHKQREEKQLLRATYMASFFAYGAAKALFFGLYQVVGSDISTPEQRRQRKAWRELESYGFNGDRTEKRQYFNLKRCNEFDRYAGKLVVEWTGERAWSRWAIKNSFKVLVLSEESLFGKDVPNWRDIVLTWAELKVLPANWQGALCGWRGIYFIFDVSDGRGFVGSAYGAENIYSRWDTYAKTGHGNNKLLRKCKPENLRFSILERFTPDTTSDEVLHRESTWKKRLHTRSFGLNKN